MVQMIPATVAEEVRSRAEREIFQKFRDFYTPRPYIILHSLGLAEHRSNIFGEVDFVILCRQGVLCVEVKGGAVSRSDGIWEYTNRNWESVRKAESPFFQAQSNMHSLRDCLKKRVKETDPVIRCQYACAVIMPDCHFDFEGPDIIPEILFDNSERWDLNTVADRAFAYWRQSCLDKHGFAGEELSDSQILRLAEMLRGDFAFVPSMKTEIERTSRELLQLTDEQYDVLDSLSLNPRLIISGVAGSGKTLLAMEQARRGFWAGRRVLFLCFNKNIAQYAAYIFAKEQVEAECSTLHNYMMNACGIRWSPEINHNAFYQEELPARFLACTELPVYDLIIIDEGQDLLNEKYWSCLEKLMPDVPEKSHWCIFLDPNQNIYNKQAELEALLGRLAGLAASWKLSINCRNTRQIARDNARLTKVSNVGKTKVQGRDVVYISYVSREDERQKINAVLRELKADGIVGQDIVILSRYRLDNEKNGLGPDGLDRDLGQLKTEGELWLADKNEIRFSTIHGFKGLEAKVVLLIDINRFADEKTRLLHYVAISRASGMLYIFHSSEAEAERQEMLGGASGPLN